MKLHEMSHAALAELLDRLEQITKSLYTPRGFTWDGFGDIRKPIVNRWSPKYLGGKPEWSQGGWHGEIES